MRVPVCMCVSASFELQMSYSVPLLGTACTHSQNWRMVQEVAWFNTHVHDCRHAHVDVCTTAKTSTILWGYGSVCDIVVTVIQLVKVCVYVSMYVHTCVRVSACLHTLLILCEHSHVSTEACAESCAGIRKHA